MFGMHNSTKRLLISIIFLSKCSQVIGASLSVEDVGTTYATALGLVASVLLIVGAGFLYMFCTTTTVAPAKPPPEWFSWIQPLVTPDYFIWDFHKSSDKMVMSADGYTAIGADLRYTHAVMSKAGFQGGKHAFEIILPRYGRGQHASIGVGKINACLSQPKAVQLVGYDRYSWGWDVCTKHLQHKGADVQSGRYGHRNVVPDQIRVYLDADNSTIGFGSFEEYYGDAIRYDRTDEPVFLMAAVSNKGESVTPRYLGSVGEAPVLHNALANSQIELYRLPPVYPPAIYSPSWPIPPIWLQQTVTPSVPITERGFDPTGLGKYCYLEDSTWIRTRFPSPQTKMSVMCRGKFGFNRGKHVFYIRFYGNMGTHCFVGIGTLKTKLTLEFQKETIIGADKQSVGFDLARRRAFHDGKIISPSYPSNLIGSENTSDFLGNRVVSVPNDILMFVDMDSKTLSFGSHTIFFGDCMRNFVNKHIPAETMYYPYIGTCTHDIMMQMIYIGQGSPIEQSVSTYNWYNPAGPQQNVVQMVQTLYQTNLDVQPPTYHQVLGAVQQGGAVNTSYQDQPPQYNTFQTNYPDEHTRPAPVHQPLAAQTVHVMTTPHSGQVLTTPQFEQGMTTPQNGQGMTTPQSGQIMMPPQSGQVQMIPQSGQVQMIPQSGQVVPSPQSGQVQTIPQSGQMMPAQSGQVMTAPQSGQVMTSPTGQTEHEQVPHADSAVTGEPSQAAESGQLPTS